MQGGSLASFRISNDGRSGAPDSQRRCIRLRARDSDSTPARARFFSRSKVHGSDATLSPLARQTAGRLVGHGEPAPFFKLLHCDQSVVGGVVA